MTAVTSQWSVPEQESDLIEEQGSAWVYASALQQAESDL